MLGVLLVVIVPHAPSSSAIVWHAGMRLFWADRRRARPGHGPVAVGIVARGSIIARRKLMLESCVMPARLARWYWRPLPLRLRWSSRALEWLGRVGGLPVRAIHQDAIYAACLGEYDAETSVLHMRTTDAHGPICIRKIRKQHYM